MRSVNVEELKNDLSACLTYAKAGEEIILRDHNQPIARIVPFPASQRESKLPPEIEAMKTPFDPETDATEEERELAAQGMLNLPTHKVDMAAFFNVPREQLRLSRAAIQAVLEDREDRC